MLFAGSKTYSAGFYCGKRRKFLRRVYFSFLQSTSRQVASGNQRPASGRLSLSVTSMQGIFVRIPDGSGRKTSALLDYYKSFTLFNVVARKYKTTQARK